MKSDLYTLRIKSIDLSVFHIATIVMTDDSVYSANLSHDFKTLFCYPKNQNEWLQGKINQTATTLCWPEGFEIHFDQIIGLAQDRKELA